MDSVEPNSSLENYLNKKQAMSSIGDMFADDFSKNKKFYTQKVLPGKTYNSIVFLDNLTPVTMIDE